MKLYRFNGVYVGCELGTFYFKTREEAEAYEKEMYDTLGRGETGDIYYEVTEVTVSEEDFKAGLYPPFHT